MARGSNEFIKGIRFPNGDTSQKEVAKETIRKQLFRILNDSNMQKGESKDLNEMVDEIANNIGLQQYRIQIAQYITQLLQTDQYQYGIDENGNIKANYTRLYMIQKETDKKGREEADEILQGFIQRVEKYAKELEKNEVKVTDASLIKQFDEIEIKKDNVWIESAIEYVLETRNEER